MSGRRTAGRISPVNGEKTKILDYSTPNFGTTSTTTDGLSAKLSNETNNDEQHFAYRNANFQAHEDGVSASTALGHHVVPALSNEKECEEVGIGDNRFDDGREINVQRPAMDFGHAGKRYGMIPETPTLEKIVSSLKSRCVCNMACFLQCLTSFVPVLSWLPKYRLEYLLPDIIAGFTIAIMHVPQGMAYGILASLKPENGLYVSFFPSLVYFFLGTSRHISVGTFAIMSLLVSSSVANSDTVPFRVHNVTETNATSVDDMLYPPTYLEMATALSVSVGVWQFIMGVFRLGSLTVVLSDQLVSGFSTAAACHVVTSMLSDVLGLNIPRYSGPLKLFYIYRDIFDQLLYTNVTTLTISAIALFTLAFVKEQINDRFKDKLKIPIPIDLIVVILGTAVSFYMDLYDNYSVRIMGSIPTGLPVPEAPRIDLIPLLITDSFVIAIIGFAVSLSMAKIFSKKHKYTIRPSQELLALGTANMVSSFFSCYPCSASLSRSLVQERSGCKTQVASVVSGCLLLLVLLVLSPLFYSLPKCILSAVILVALKGMFLQVKDLFRAWKVSKTDALIWLATFIGTLILDVSYGLLCGVIFTILTVIFRTAVPSKSMLGNVIGTDLYLDIERFADAREIKGIKIFHFHSALYFMNMEYFKVSLHDSVTVPPSEIDEETRIKSCADYIHHLIIDCSSFTYLDTSGLETLQEMIKEYDEAGIVVFLAGCSVTLYDVMLRAKFFETLPARTSVFPTIHDAIQYCNN